LKGTFGSRNIVFRVFLFGNLVEDNVFGVCGWCRGEQKKRSGVDILAEFEESFDLSLLDFIGLESYLGLILGVKVDLVEKQTLKPRIGKHVLEEVVGV
jgi:predicted nucleotidyltransferase